MILTAIVATSVVLVVFGIDTLLTAPETFTAMVAVLLLAVALEYLWSAIRRRRDATDTSHAEDGQQPAARP